MGARKSSFNDLERKKTGLSGFYLVLVREYTKVVES